ncbi:pyruvate kinase [Aerococcaceae bacterium WGS1372]
MEKTDRDLQTELLNDLIELYKDVRTESEHEFNVLEANIVREEFKASAKNLLAYLALRRRDIRDLQAELSSWGLSSLGRSESRALFTLESVIKRLSSTLGTEVNIDQPSLHYSTAGQQRLLQNTQLFFGEASDNRQTRIMVTMPTEVSEDKKLVRRFIKSGMNIARINAAHDNPEIWKAMIENIHDIAEEEGKSIKILIDIAGPKIRTDWIFTRFKKPKVQAGDKIRMTRNYHSLPSLDDDIKVTVGCSVSNIFNKLKIDDPVLLDDGAVEMRVQSVNDEEAILNVEKVKGNSLRIKAEKGLNFPQTEFDVDVITEADKESIRFAVEHADMIGYSFIRTAKDIEEIQNEIQRATDRPLSEIPLTLKIETIQAMNNLPEVVLKAGSKNPISVMIARGDLAVESGYVRLAELQQEILWICEASDTPVIWGTEVLATMLEEGIPSRAEVTDAAEGSRAECVMLNKGTYLPETIQMLHDILVKMEEHQVKKTPKLRSLKIAKMNVFDNTRDRSK